ncbi:hypothetical protein QP166_05885 [Sphingomonas sp. LR60]|uniref:hypothetical protein n=1 Tax=Sphingomonas sp. LR60 TaxID=3050233 RepID=UPI002FE32FDB
MFENDGASLPPCSEAEQPCVQLGGTTGATKTAPALAAMLLLEACGGGGSEASPAPVASTPSVAGPTTPVVVVEAKPTAMEASRFLQQATMGGRAHRSTR